MARADREALVEVARAHAQAEADGNLEQTLATLEGEPVYELASVGLAFRGRAAARAYYEHFFGTFQPLIAGYELVNEWASDEGLGQEYWIHVALPNGTQESHRVIGILTFGERLLSGERLYASERLLRRMLGPAYEEALRQSRSPVERARDAR